MVKQQPVYTFCGFRLDVSNKRLEHDGNTVPLTPKVFDTLVLLVENSPNLVEKSVLMDTLWPGQFVEESNITFNIKMLRKALDDNASAPRFIETVTRRGYRFIASIDGPPERALPAQKILTNSVWPIYFAGILALAVIAGLIIAGIWATRTGFSRNATSLLSAEYTTTKITDTGKVHHAVISPDGKYVAYTNEVNGRQSLWLRQISTGGNMEILEATDLPFFGLTFSHDSENIFYTRREFGQDTQPAIFTISIFGGPPTKIVDESQGKIGLMPDNKGIIFVRYDKGSHDQNKLIMVDADGKNERLIKESESPNVFWSFTISRDSKKVIVGYGHTNNASQNMRLAEVDIDSGEQTDLTDQKFFQISDFAWLKDQNGFVFTGSETLGATSRIWSFNYETRLVENITKDANEYVNISLNNSQDKLLATTLSADFGIFAGTAPSKNRYLTQARDGFSFAPGNKIVYAGDAAGSEDIWIMNDTGTNQRQLTTDKAVDAYPLVSTDNRVYFTSNRTGENRIWRMGLDGSEQVQLTKTSGGMPIFVSTDGKWLYYTSNIDQWVWRSATDGSEERRLFPQRTGFYQAFSPDGSKMAYLYRNAETGQFGISVLSVETNQIIKQYAIADGRDHPYFLNWTQEENALSYIRKNADGDYILWLQPYPQTQQKPLFNLGSEEVLDCRIAPDGTNYVFIRGRWKHDAVLINPSL